MSFPFGVTVCEISYGPPRAVDGSLGEFTALSLWCDRKIVHAATGEPLYPDVVDIKPNRGAAAVIELPHVDQDGFVDEAGNAIRGWSYTIAGRYRFDGDTIKLSDRDFQVLTGQDHVDLDLIPRGRSLAPVVAPTAAVTSVAGHTGPVSPQQLATALGGLIGDGTGGPGSSLTPLPDRPLLFQIGA